LKRNEVKEGSDPLLMIKPKKKKLTNENPLDNNNNNIQSKKINQISDKLSENQINNLPLEEKETSNININNINNNNNLTKTLNFFGDNKPFNIAINNNHYNNNNNNLNNYFINSNSHYNSINNQYISEHYKSTFKSNFFHDRDMISKAFDVK
jgi:hypothetical protein